MLIFVALLSRGFESLVMPSFSTNFYDLQARAILHGHLWIPTGAASLEGIQYGGHTYIYFGPFLALLRLPIIWLFPGASGHLSQISMVVGATLLVASASWLSWQVRRVVLGSAGPGRADLVLQGGVCAVLLGGSVTLYLAGSPSVYFETELWGAALAVAALAAFVSFMRSRSTPSAVALGAGAAFDAMTRVSVAVGPVLLVLVALGSTVVAHGRGRSERRDNTPVGADAAPLYALGAGAVAAVALPCWFNWARFHSLLSIPWDHQVVALQTPAVKAFYQHNGTFVLANLPSTLGWYLRPWNLLTTGLFPFFSFPSHTPVTAHSHFLAAGRATSIPSSMPLFFVLGLAGALILIGRPGAGRRPEPVHWTAIRIAALAALAGSAPVLVFDTIANRYLADILPLLVLTSLVSLWSLKASWRLERSAAVLAAAAAAIGLALYSALVNLSLGLQEALVFGPSPTPEQRAGLVGWQLSLHQALPIPLPFPASTGTIPPDRPVPGQLFVQSGCAGVYEFNGPIWNELEVGPSGGSRVMDVRVPESASRVTEPLLTASKGSDPATYQYFSIEYGPSNRYRILYESRPWDGFQHRRQVVSAPWYQLPANRQLHMTLTIAGKAPEGAGIAEARVAGEPAFFPEIPVDPTDTWTVGRLPGGSSFGGDIHLDDVPTPLCAQAQRAIGSNGR